MATILDALVVQLGLDPKGFTQGQREAAASAAAFQKQLDDADKKSQARDAAAGQRQLAVSKSDTAAKTRDLTTRTAVEKKADQERQQAHKAETQRRSAADKAERDATSDKAKAEKEAQKKRAEGFTLAKDAALGFGAALAAIGIREFVKSSVAGVAETGRLAHNLDMSSKDLAAWGLAVEKSVGGSAEEAKGSLAGLGTALLKLRTGQDLGILKTFALLKFADPKHEDFDLRKKDGKPLGALDVAKQIAARGQRTDPQLFATTLADAGYDQGSINLLEKGPGAVQSALDEAGKRAPTNEDVRRAEELQVAEKGLAQSFTRLAQMLTLNFAPDLTRFLNDFSNVFSVLTGKMSVKEFLQHRADDWKAEQAAKGVYGPPAPKVGGDAAGGDAAPSSGVSGWLWRNMGIRMHHKASGSASTLPGGLDPDVEAEVRKDAAARGVDPQAAVALFRTEGGGKTKTSPAGAFGPAQLMPGTAAELGLATAPDDADYSWRSNVDGGVRLLAKLINQYHGNVQAAEAAYNAGPAGRGVAYFAATGDPSKLAHETQNYITRIQASLVPTGAGAGPTAIDHSSENHIGSIHVHGVDTNNARSVAAGMSGALSNHPLVAQSNTGLS